MTTETINKKITVNKKSNASSEVVKNVASKKRTQSLKNYKLHIGRRKRAVVKLYSALKTENDARIFFNDVEIKNVFKRTQHIKTALSPLQIVDEMGSFDMFAYANGGGLTGQAEALRYAVTRMLSDYNPNFKPVLKSHNLTTRDSRVVESKKAGFRKARKKEQFSKR